MSKIFAISSILCSSCIFVLISHLGISLSDTVINYEPLDNPSKLTIHNGQLYIGARNKIYRLNSDLSENFTIQTCPTGCSSPNYNKVLLVTEDTGNEAGKVVACGTGNQGRCEAWSLRNLSGPSNKSEENFVSENRRRPAEAVYVSKNFFMLAKTYGQGSGGWFHISLPNLDNSFGVKLGIKLLNVGPDNQETFLNDYLVYFKASLQLDGFSYFLTNQKAFKNNDLVVSKIVRICRRDSILNDGDNLFYSYHDMILQCTVNETSYNLVQDAVFVKTKNGNSTLTIAFAQGSDPENPEGRSAICSITTEKLKTLLKKAALEFFSCKNYSDDMLYLKRTASCPFNVSTIYIYKE